MPRRLFLLLPIAVLALATVPLGCSKGGGGGGDIITPPPPGNPSWHWVSPVTEGNSLTDIWGSSADNLFATGQDGVVMRYDGSKWRITRAPTSRT